MLVDLDLLRETLDGIRRRNVRPVIEEHLLTRRYDLECGRQEILLVLLGERSIELGVLHVERKELGLILAEDELANGLLELHFSRGRGISKPAIDCMSSDVAGLIRSLSSFNIPTSPIPSESVLDILKFFKE